MTLLARRRLFGGALALLAAPAVIRTPGLLMPVVRPFELVRRRHAVAFPAIFTGEVEVWHGVVVRQVDPAEPTADELWNRVVEEGTRLPSWINSDTRRMASTRDHGYLHGIGWEAMVYERPA